LDNGRLLVNTYVDLSGRHMDAQYNGALICDPAGKVLTNPTLPELKTAQLVAPDSVYSAQPNQIFSLPSGARTWSSGNVPAGIGSATGTQVIFASGHLVLAQPH
jgi:uncharacterized Fe-S cluster protein YjdI